MAEKILIADVRVDDRDPELLLVRSPAVGVADGVPRTGIYLNPLDRILTIRALRQRFSLLIPRDRQGRIVEAMIPNASTPVDFGQPLLRLDPRAAVEGGGAVAGAAGAAVSAEAAAAGAIEIPAPSEGIFYRRSSPDSPPYVEEGSPVAAGTILGLVEVMKCFNQIAYGGPGLPEKGEVVRILAEDAAEVEFGQPLFWVRPAK